jgi:hypothetical protein
MVMKVRSRWRSLALLLGLGLLALTVPAQAASVTPTFVGGSSTCSSVNSAGTSVLTLVAPIGTDTYTGPGGAEITVTLTNNRGTAFNFSITGGLVYDVIVKGSGSNWYDYDGSPGGPVLGDNGLVIPNGNKLNTVHFCYVPGIPIGCDPVAVEEGGTSGSFTRTTGNCSDGKTVVIDVINDTVVFIPSGGGASTYLGTITFTKSSADANALVLLYDKLANGTFTPVPDCDAGPALPDPNPDGDTWCVITAGADYLGESLWLITWDVYGEGDPLFK